MRQMPVAIACEDVSRRIAGNSILSQVSFAVAAREAVALIGASGSGKTSLLRLIAGLDRPSAGRISLEGKLASDESYVLPPHQRGIGMVFQRAALWPHLTVAQNVAFGLDGLARAEAGRRVAEILALTRAQGLEHRSPRQLSGGEAQRVSLARALAPRPRFLLLDEPLSGLDPALHVAMLDLFRQVRQETGVTMIYVTHDHEEAASIAERVLILREGRLIHDGGWEQRRDSE